MEMSAIAQNDQPDILLILVDQWNPRMLGCAGDPVVRTPHIDALANEGAFFRNAYTQAPVCMPARCSLFSGQYPHNHGFWMNFTGQAFPADQITLFRDLKSAGYTTAKIGKYHFYNLEWGDDHRNHADYYAALDLDWAQELPTPYMGPYLRTEYTEHLQRLGLLEPYIEDTAYRYQEGDFDIVAPSPLPADHHIDGYVAAQAVSYLDSAPADRPLFLCVSFPGPHTPFDAPEPYASMYNPADLSLAPNVPKRFKRQGRPHPQRPNHFDREHVRKAQANYYGKLTHLDDRVGQVVQAMQKRGNWENTLFIFAADHGEYLGSHGRFAKGGFEEESARIPMIMRWPKRIHPGKRIDALAQWIDIYATAIEAAEGQMSSDRFGKSLLPLTDGTAAYVHNAVFSEIARQGQTNFMVRAGGDKWFMHGNEEHLYDLSRDPYEQHDLVGSPAHRNRISALKETLLDFLTHTQVNHAAGYQNLFTRIGLDGGDETLLSERFLPRLYEVHKETEGQ